MKAAVFAAALVAALAIAPAPARAQSYDFTITVPVNLSGLPDNITAFVVSCYILPATSTVLLTSDIIASALKSTPVHGSFHGNVVITMNAAPGKDPALAGKYKCTGQVTGTLRGASGVGFFPAGPTSTPSFPLVAGAPFYMGSTSASDLTRIPGR
jgi:hypothetical protein